MAGSARCFCTFVVLNTDLVMKSLISFALGLATLGLAGCSTLELPVEVPPANACLSVETRSTQVPLQYPVTVYVFDPEGRNVAQQEIAAAGSPLALNLSAGDYRIVALSGQKDLLLSDPTPTSSSSLALLEANYAAAPLMRGEASVHLVEGKTRVSLAMSIAMAEVALILRDIPTEVQHVSARLDRQHSRISLSGTCSAPRTTTFACTRQTDGSWTASGIYVLPGAEANTVLTLDLQTPGQSRQYSATLSTPLRAATPYRFEGGYAGGPDQGTLTLSGDFVAEGWQAACEGNFIFGPGHDGARIETGTSPEAPVTQAGTVWQGSHVAALITGEGTDNAQLLLLSRQEWNDLPSALSVDEPGTVAEIVRTYAEDGLAGWSIPTKEEARQLSALYSGDALAALNALFDRVGGLIIIPTGDSGTALRYLCEDGTYTFTKASITKAGTKAHNYNLRLVKRVPLK